MNTFSRKECLHKSGFVVSRRALGITISIIVFFIAPLIYLLCLLQWKFRKYQPHLCSHENLWVCQMYEKFQKFCGKWIFWWEILIFLVLNILQIIFLFYEKRIFKAPPEEANHHWFIPPCFSASFVIYVPHKGVLK